MLPPNLFNTTVEHYPRTGFSENGSPLYDDRVLLRCAVQTKKVRIRRAQGDVLETRLVILVPAVVVTAVLVRDKVVFHGVLYSTIAPTEVYTASGALLYTMFVLESLEQNEE